TQRPLPCLNNASRAVWLQGATAKAVMLSLLEVIVDRLADVLERVGRDVDTISRGIFAKQVAQARARRSEGWRPVLEEIGRKGDMISNIRDSLGTLDRLIVFFGQRLRGELAEAEQRERVQDLANDIRGLADHSNFAAQKVTFLLDATLGLIGIGYGIVSGLVVGAIAQYWHKNQFGRIAGRLYIAWCAAAISLPVVAGALFDQTGSYASAVWVAAGINVLGMLVARSLPSAKQQPIRGSGGGGETTWGGAK
ncbi:MAG: hypothetical protein HC807_04930, partial [Gammaproteobacteria bacterium]|nr:hypothetical protein [Gammaproteobacteria bacterium]